MNGYELRKTAIKSGFRFWRIAQEMNVSDATLTRMFRKNEVPALYEKLFYDALETLKQEKAVEV